MFEVSTIPDPIQAAVMFASSFDHGAGYTLLVHHTGGETACKVEGSERASWLVIFNPGKIEDGTPIVFNPNHVVSVEVIWC